ncbi:MAG: UDP-N-acetylmuramate dehydrogenase [Chlorobiales bacterium]|nr:UDP-N-acetylmuramate dehydrogenase [Chlorobiales bacterium]
MRDHTWYGLGGPAAWLVSPRDESELATVLARCTTEKMQWRILGHGANLLVPDDGFQGVVIRLAGEVWERVAFRPPLVEAAAGMDFPKLVKHSLERGLVGLENLAGIPGSVGGVIRQNAGGRYGTIADYVRQVRLLGADGEVQVRAATEMAFAYRSSQLDGGVVVAATLELQTGDSTAALERHRTIWSEKYASQPPVSARSAGCIFKNPPGGAAGRLIDEAGLKGQRCGAAEISTKHANFIVAHPGATTRNVLDLITLAKERVFERTGVQLELEVEVW